MLASQDASGTLGEGSNYSRELHFTSLLALLLPADVCYRHPST